MIRCTDFCPPREGNQTQRSPRAWIFAPAFRIATGDNLWSPDQYANASKFEMEKREMWRGPAREEDVRRKRGGDLSAEEGGNEKNPQVTRTPLVHLRRAAPLRVKHVRVYNVYVTHGRKGQRCGRGS